MICITIAHFPLPVMLSIAATTIFIMLTYNVYSDSIVQKDLTKMALSLIVTFFLAVWLKLYGESQNLKSWKFYMVSFFIPLIIWGVFFYFFKSDINNSVSFTYVIVTLFGIISLLFFSPYIPKIATGNFSENSYYTYFYTIATIFLLSIILWIILFLLGFIAIMSVYALFDLSYISQDKIIRTWAAVSLSLITPFFALTQVPKKEDFFGEYFNENAFFSFLIRFVVIPFVFVYFIILYLYSFRVLLNFNEWPRGEVSWMVIGFSILWYVSYIFSYIFEKKNIVISRLRKYFPYVVLPQLCMLFYAIYLRIAQYDITTNRYLVVTFGIGLTIISFYYIVSKTKRLIVIPAILTLFTILVSIGPWSVYLFPLNRQYIRLKKNLVTANICSDMSCKEITPLHNYSDISADISKNIYSGIQYVCEFENCDKIKELFPKIFRNLEEKRKKEYAENNLYSQESSLSEASKWEIINEVTDTIKVRTYSPVKWDGAYEYFYFNAEGNDYPFDVVGYNTLYEINFYGGRDAMVRYNSQNKILSVGSWALKRDISMQAIFSDLIDKSEKGKKFIYNWDNFKMIILNANIIKNQDISFSTENDTNNRGEYMHWYILLK